MLAQSHLFQGIYGTGKWFRVFSMALNNMERGVQRAII
jgi:hypothetical protein